MLSLLLLVKSESLSQRKNLKKNVKERNKVGVPGVLKISLFPGAKE